MRYPVLGPASVIDCPVHGHTVALDNAGRIASRCHECQREQALARHRWAQRRYRDKLDLRGTVAA